jgi:dephospho-CoA kinase
MKSCDIGLIGLAGSGKDTAAMALIAHGWRRMAFADHLKELARSFGWDGHKDERGRKLLQDLGMAARAYNPNFWINKAYYGLTAVHSNFSKIPRVWTDVRFQNEADFVRSRGGLIVRIQREGHESRDSHESETNQYGIHADYNIKNNGTITQLHDKIIEILQND